MKYPERWGHLRSRYETEKPRKMLALDGGGIRGVMTLGILSKLESILRAKLNAAADFRLCDYFDYIAGTSTGAIIAAGLARGMTADELIQFYRETGPLMFESSRLLGRLVSFYKADPLRKKLREVFNSENGRFDSNHPDVDLSPEHLRCLLLVVTRNMTTDSPWPISSNPEARYNDPARPDCNLRIPLWQLVRASSAAPVYFPPETLEWDKSNPEKTFVFVDGGVTPYNNPAFLLYRMATQKNYRLEWKTGEKNLLLVSVGTGSAASPSFKKQMNIAANVTGLPGGLMYGIQVDQDINCRAVGRCIHGAMIDRELYDMTCRDATEDSSPSDWFKAPHVSLDEDLGRAFLYARYNANLSKEGLEALGLGDLNPDDVQKLDSIDHIEDLLQIGYAVGDEINASNFGSFI